MTERELQIVSRLFTWAVALVAALAVGSHTATPAESSRFCMVPVSTPSDFHPTDARNQFLVPGLPGPVYTGGFHKRWIITADRTLRAYTEPFPRNYLDTGDWVAEPWRPRVIATRGCTVYVLEPGAGPFKAIPPDTADDDRCFGRAVAFPGFQQTIVVGFMEVVRGDPLVELLQTIIEGTKSPSGDPFVVEQNRLRPWMRAEGYQDAGIDSFHSLYDAPSLEGVLALTGDKRFFVLADGTWHPVVADSWWQRTAALDIEDSGRAIDLPKIGTIVYLANRAVVAIRRSGKDGTEFVAERLATAPGSGASFPFHHSKVFDELLYYRASDHPFRWQRITADGLEDIPGGQIGTPALDMQTTGWMSDARAIGAVIIRADDGLHSYDGKAIHPVVGADATRFGDASPRIVDLPSIGRTLVTSVAGLFEITADGNFTKLEMPFRTTGFPRPQFADWPEANVALAAVDNAIFAVDRDLEASPVPGGRAIRTDWTTLFASGSLPETGDKVLTGRNGLFLAVDTLLSGPEPCAGIGH